MFVMASGLNVAILSGASRSPIALLAQGQGASGLWPLLLPWVLVMGIFYVLLILPQHRQRKKLQEMLAALKAGDKVITSGGIYGTVVGLEPDAVQLRVADQVKIKVSRAAIAGMQPEAKES